jgi:hypothetical protein
MKTLISHALSDHSDEVLKSSIRNCHVHGMHSLMFENTGRKIRMFYTTPEHELWKNTPENYTQWLSIGFHPHHCNITLAPLVGSILNWEIIESPLWELSLDAYHFQSHIQSGKWWFQKLQDSITFKTQQILKIQKWKETFMQAKDIHSVWVDIWEEVAWIVIEGKENPHHNEKCYSNVDLETWSPQWLYTPYICIDEIREDLFRLWIL